MRSFAVSCLICFSSLTLFTACDFSAKEVAPEWLLDQVFQTTFNQLRLGDGVPLSLNVSIRWVIEDTEDFQQQFANPESFDSLILYPRGLELAATLTNTYPSVDSVFTVDRQTYLTDLKRVLVNRLGEEGIRIKEVMVSDLGFPIRFTQAKEEVGLKEQELEHVRQKSEVSIARATAQKAETDANSQVAIAQAKAQDQLEKIHAQIEQTRRKKELTKAETKRQVAETQAKADARRKELLALADLKQQKDLKLLEVSHQRNLQQADLDKQIAINKADFAQQIELAKLCQENPTYASFLVNKELASHVQIAVLPANAGSNVFGDLLQQKMVSKKDNP